MALNDPQSNTSKVTVDAKHFFYLTFSNVREASKAIRFMAERAVTHVANRHTIFQGEMQASLIDLKSRLHAIAADLHVVAKAPTAVNVETMVKHAKKLNRDIDRAQVELVNIIGRQHVSIHSAEMYLGFLQGMRDLANRYVAVAMQERALAQIVAGANVDTELTNAQMRSQVFGSTVRTNSDDIVKTSVEEDDAADKAQGSTAPAAQAAPADSTAPAASAAPAAPADSTAPAASAAPATSSAPAENSATAESQPAEPSAK